MITTYKIKNDSGSTVVFGTINILTATEHLILAEEILNGSAVIVDIPQYNTINKLLIAGTVSVLRDDIALGYIAPGYIAEEWFKHYYDSEGRNVSDEYTWDHVIETSDAHTISAITGLQAGLDSKADKVVGATDKDVATLDTNGNLTDSGYTIDDTVETASNLWSANKIKSEIGASGGGDVSGPASSVDTNIATFNGVTGKIIQDGGTKISDLALQSNLLLHENNTISHMNATQNDAFDGANSPSGSNVLATINDIPVSVGQVDSVVSGTNISVDNTDPVNPIVSSTDTTYTDAEIKTKYENNTNTNEFSDAEQTKLAGIEDGAEVNIPQTYLHADLTDKATDGHNADIIAYDNVASGLTSIETQAAIDEVVGYVDNNSTLINAVSNDLSTHENNVSNPHVVTATQVGLGNVDNTSDTDKPISTATQTALDGKEDSLTNADVKTKYEANADTNAFTDSEQTKLSNLESSKFVGQYATLTALETANPSPSIGEYGYVNSSGVDIKSYIWDVDDSIWVDSTPGIISPHSALSGLGNDDHTQYHNDTRGDARYYQQTVLDIILAGKKDDFSENTGFNKNFGTTPGTVSEGDHTHIGYGDMFKATYDTNNSGVVDDSEKVNNLTVETAVPVGAVFTDTTYTDSEIKTKYENNADTNAFTDAEQTKLAGIEAGAEVNVPQTYLHADLTDSATSGHNADIIAYDNVVSGLTAIEVQSAITELDNNVDTIDSSLTSHTNDTTIHFTESSIDHTVISNIGTNSHSVIDTHLADVTKHRIINDSGTSTTDIWSADKINTEISSKGDVDGPVSSINDNIAVFDGTTGKLIKDGGNLISDLALKSDLTLHENNTVVHMNATQNDAFDGANNPSGTNVLATIADLPTAGGQVNSVVAGTNVTVDNTDPVNPIVSSTDTTYTDAEIKTKYENNADTNAYTDAEQTKLAGVADGAEVNVNSDWNAISGDAEILNKPTIPENTDKIEFARPFSGTYIGTTVLQISRAGTTIVANSGVIPLVRYHAGVAKEITKFNYSMAISGGGYQSVIGEDVTIVLMINDVASQTTVIPAGSSIAGVSVYTPPISLSIGDAFNFAIYSTAVGVLLDGIVIDATIREV